MTGVLICPPHASRESWLAMRRGGIGASEIAAVLGISPWDSPFSLYWRKREGWDVEVNDEMRTGTLVEPVVADWWLQGDVHEHLALMPGGLYAHADRPWQLATPDRLVYMACPSCADGPPDPWGCTDCLNSGHDPRVLAVLECKWAATWHGWGDEGTDDIPVYYRAQVQWQCDVMGVDEWYLAVLGPGGFRAYQGRRDERDLDIMREAGRVFWQRLQAGITPSIDEHSATTGALKRLHPSVGDFDVDLVGVLGAEEAIAFAEGYRRARALRARADALVGRYENRIRGYLAGGRRVTCNSKLVASRSVYDQSGDTAELTALEGDWPVVDRLNPGRSATYA